MSGVLYLIRDLRYLCVSVFLCVHISIYVHYRYDIYIPLKSLPKLILKELYLIDLKKIKHLYKFPKI